MQCIPRPQLGQRQHRAIWEPSLVPEVVYVQRKKPRQRKPKQKKAPRVVYVTDSDDEELEDEVFAQQGQPQPWYNFV